MPNELEQKIWTEKYRCKDFNELVFCKKSQLLSYLKKPKELPSFLLFSKSPGTGKTTTAKLIQKYLDCDCLRLNASVDRGIQIVREKVKQFASSLSSNPEIKRMVFMDEFGGMTSIAQNSMRNVMEEYSSNVFFLLTANNISKVIAPIKSRCILFDFDSPNKEEIFKRLEYIAEKEQIEYIPSALKELINIYYPDVRQMINCLQNAKINNESIDIYLSKVANYEELWEDIRNKDINKVKEQVFKNKVDIINFNAWIFKYLFQNWEKVGFEKASKIVEILAEIEIGFGQQINADIIFLNGMMKIMEVL